MCNESTFIFWQKHIKNKQKNHFFTFSNFVNVEMEHLIGSNFNLHSLPCSGCSELIWNSILGIPLAILYESCGKKFESLELISGICWLCEQCAQFEWVTKQDAPYKFQYAMDGGLRRKLLMKLLEIFVIFAGIFLNYEANILFERMKVLPNDKITTEK